MTLVLGYIIDLIFGDPYSLPHPIVLIGKSISNLERILRKNIANEKIAGVLLAVLIIAPAYILPLIILMICREVNQVLALAVETFMIFQILATTSLGKESKKVFYPLKEGNILEARRFLSYIVGRNTEELGEKEIIRATVETIAENISDGIIAPMLFIALGGAPLGVAYKAINTLDSMVGYKNDKYINLGYASAKIDDLANLIPARLTGIFIVISSFILSMDYKQSMKMFLRDCTNHSSPNSGYPESATAGALGVQLGGTNTYFGKRVFKPTIGDENRELQNEDILETIKIMYVTSFIGLIVTVPLMMLI